MQISAITQAIRDANSFGAVVAQLRQIGAVLGEDQSEADAQGQLQYGLKKRGQKYREKINSAAKEILARVQGDPSKLTAADRGVLLQYSGRGGLQSENSLTEYYTPPEIAEGTWDAMKANGFESGNVLEPSCGAGVFMGTKPGGVKLTGAEIDETSSGVAALLNPDDQVTNQSFEELAVAAPDNSFDSVIGNVPFGDTRGKWANHDPDYKHIKLIEMYFVTRAVDKCKPGGLICLIVPNNIIDRTTKRFLEWRQDLSRKAEFLGAHKLPSGTFGGQNGNGTDTSVSVLVMRKHSRELLDKIPDIPFKTLREAKVLWPTWFSGRWFKSAEGKKFVYGTEKEGFGGRVTIESDMNNAQVKQLLAKKFDSRIDYALLETAETITRNYRDGDRREFAGVMHEFQSGDWVKVDNSIGTDGSLDKAKFGVESENEYIATLQDARLALSLTYQQAKAGVRGPYTADAATSVKEAVRLASRMPEALRERTYRAALVGHQVAMYSLSVSRGEAQQAVLEQLQGVVVAEIEKYGHPAMEKGFRRLRGAGASAVESFKASVKLDGGFNDLLAGRRTDEQAASYNADDPADVVRFLSARADRPVSLADINELTSKPVTLEQLAGYDTVAVTPDGQLQSFERYAAGHVVQKIHRMQQAMAYEDSPAIQAKYQSQIDAINQLRTHTETDNITFGLRSRWIDRKYVEQFIRQKGWDRLELNGNQFKIPDAKTFDAQLEKYLNGGAVTSSKAEIKAEYNQKIHDLEEEFGIWVRQHEDVDELTERYNDVFNGYIPAEYSSGDLQLQNVSGQVKPHWYQGSGVRRMSDEGRGILAFDVGLGKTFSALAFAQYHTQQGRAKRSCIVVPKAVLENWYHETRQFHKSMSHVHFIGFTPTGDREPVLDEEGNPKRNKLTGEPEMRDVLKEDTPDILLKKMHEIPHTSKSLVVMSKERFGEIPMRMDTREAYADRMVDRNLMRDSEAASLAMGEDVKLGRGGSYNAAKQTERYQQIYSDDGTDKKSQFPYYEDMGFDTVVVDEGHEFKNTYTASGDTARLAYLPTPPSSKRAIDMAVKMDYLRSRNNGNGAYMLTATPVTNSPTEIFNMLSHIASIEEFESMGIYNVDDFVREFCQVQSVERVKLSGDVVIEEGVAGFKNLDALRTLFHRFVNMKSAKDVNDADNSLKMPDANEVNAAVDMLPIQAEIYEELRKEADAINQDEYERLNSDGTVSLEEARPVFSIIRDMDRVTTDLDLFMKTMTFTFPAKYAEDVKDLVAALPEEIKKRVKGDGDNEGETVMVTSRLEEMLRFDNDGQTVTLVVPEAYEKEVVSRLKGHKIPLKGVAHPVMPKYAKMLENLRKGYESGGKQLIFTEEKSQHDKLKRIITHHLPIAEGEVAIINSDTASGDKLEKISASYNSGKARIVIANKKAEVGVNLQKGTTAIHHLTLPWTPASIQQRNGRGVRQGNTAASVDVFYYLGKGSFDEYRLNLLKHKASWIGDLFNGSDHEVSNANAGMEEEYAAMLAANPEEQKRRIAARRAEKEQAKRDRANQRATIDLANHKTHKLFLQEFDQRLASTLQRAADPAAARKRMEEKKARAESQLKLIEGNLHTAQDKGRIDIDARRLLKDGDYLTTLSGLVITQGDYFEWRERFYQADLDLESSTVTLRVMGNGLSIYNRPVSRLPKGLTPVSLSKSEMNQQMLLSGDLKKTYADLPKLGLDQAWLSEHSATLIKKLGNVLYRETADGPLLYHSPSKRVPDSAILVLPEPENKVWQREAMELLYRSYKAESTHNRHPVHSFGNELLGGNWLSDAGTQFGKNADAQQIAIAAEQAEAQQIAALLTRLEEGIKGVTGEQRVSTIYRHMQYLTSNPTSVQYKLYEQVEALLSEQGFDNDNVEELRSSAKAGTERVIAQFKEKAELLLIEAKQAAEIELAEKEEKQAAINALLPGEVKEFFDTLGIKVRLNTDTWVWKPRNKGARSYTSEPGERMMFFDPAGRNGPLADKAAGRSAPLQRDYDAVWSIVGNDLWWHIPMDTVKSKGFEKLMGVFDD
ncbi:MAG: SNF2-related protein [Marinobacterium sp.]|nr:SNF2-related protein [Marinobacterium sp.]